VSASAIFPSDGGKIANGTNGFRLIMKIILFVDMSDFLEVCGALE